MFTLIPAGIRHRFIGTIYCNLTETYCFHEIASFKQHTYITLYDCIKVLVVFLLSLKVIYEGLYSVRS